MNKEAFLLLVNKYLAGKASPEEEQLLINYFESFQQAADWDEQALGAKEVVERQLLERLQAALPVRRTPVLRLRRPMLAAAAIIFILAASFFLLKSWLQKPLPHMLEAVTRFKERRLVQLEDGTEIWLEPGSRLLYPEHFNGSTREIRLTGGAFFEVAKKPDHPFIIHTGTLSTKVLGTSFNIKAYTALRQEVTVVTGKVMVQADNAADADTAQVILAPNQQAAWNEQQRRVEKSALPNAAYYAQRRYGKFIYEGETIASVLDDIRQQYQVQVQLDGSASACTFYGDFDVRQDADKVLNALAATLNAKVKKEGTNTYHITGGGCASSK